ncbi:hypothetical protein B9Z19DRAFT_1193072 [Tuber borchii]|uniref:Uncharacterized protein n=1 Tax=Tuber borchii TaxID=42251 RepID=A0A2T6ZTK1_TUBBO|nr:hypothetical protein B9Z19DRAFT_1193072 [Tuber borchii]
MLDALDELLGIYSAVLIEELLEGEKGSLTLMVDGQGNFMASPIVQRFDQVSGVMPWSGHVPVTKNSRVLSAREEDSCHRAAKIENLNGAGRPGRDYQDSLCAMAAKGFGWEYPTFVRK